MYILIHHVDHFRSEISQTANSQDILNFAIKLSLYETEVVSFLGTKFKIKLFSQSFKNVDYFYFEGLELA